MKSGSFFTQLALHGARNIYLVPGTFVYHSWELVIDFDKVINNSNSDFYATLHVNNAMIYRAAPKMLTPFMFNNSNSMQDHEIWDVVHGKEFKCAS
jgi:hypothetical protein